MRAFADSFYFLALLNHNDPAHAPAIRRSSQLGLEIVTTRWVLVEVADALCAPLWRERVVAFIDHLARQPDVFIRGESDALFDRGLAYYRRRPDKHWSLTDCISFVVMEQEGLRDALTGDRHFAQAGFNPVFAE